MKGQRKKAVGVFLALIYSVGWSFTVPLAPTIRTSSFVLPPSCFKSHALAMAIQSTDLEREEDDVNIESVSDAEALLACRAYLQRRNLLDEWTQSKQRKRRREQAAKDLRDSSWDSDSNGFFWEDPSELKYFHRSPAARNASIMEDIDVLDELDENDNEDNAEDDEEEEEKLWETLSPRRIDRSVEYHDTEEDQEEEDLRLQNLEDYSAFDTQPPASHVRRSQAAKRMWADPVWKAKWYKQRWGSGPKRTAKQREQARLLEKRLRALQPDSLLSNEKLVEMTGEEIADAIRTYVLSKRRRSKSTKKALKERKEALAAPLPKKKLPRDFLLNQDPDTLREAQRLRSEKSKKAYARRLENQAADPKVKSSPSPSSSSSDSRSLELRRSYMSTALTPRDALLRIELALEQGVLPPSSDVELMLEPTKMGKRKDVLRRILRDHYGLRGKCIPVDLKQPEQSDFVFATQCSIQQLGDFVVYKLRESKEQES